MQAAKVTGSKFCGPTTLSCLTGLCTKTVAKIMSSKRKNGGAIKSVQTHEVQSFLSSLGYEYTKYTPENNRLSFFVENEAQNNVKYLIFTERHVFGLFNNDVFCTQFGGKPTNYSQSQYRSEKIENVIEITKEPDLYYLEKLIYQQNEQLKEEKKQAESKKKQFYCLVKMYKLEVYDDLKDKYDPRLQVYFPDGFNDPLDTHTFFSYEEAIEEIVESVKQMKVGV